MMMMIKNDEDEKYDDDAVQRWLRLHKLRRGFSDPSLLRCFPWQPVGEIQFREGEWEAMCAHYGPP